MISCMIVSVSFIALPALAQDGKGGDRRDRDGRRDRELRRDIEREKWKQKFDLKGFLEKLDVDKSGVLEASEIENDRTKRFLSQVGINADNPVTIKTAVNQVQAAADKKRDAERKNFESQVGPQLNTFGVQASPMGVAAFGVAENSDGGITTFDERLTGLKPTDFDEKSLKDARQRLEGYDRDNSGFLEGDEIGRIRWQDPKPIESDLNGDGRLSLLEMAKRLQIKSDARAKKSERRDERVDKDTASETSQNRRPERGASETGASERAALYRSEKSTYKSSSSSRSSKGNAKSSRPANVDKAYAKYIDGVFKKYDTDGDSRLSTDELKAMKRPLKGDTDRDGFLSKEEATESIKVKSGTTKNEDSQTSAASTGDRSRERSGVMTSKNSDKTSSKASDKTSGKTYSRKNGSSRGANPRGSLSDMDANSDGQIQMSEFSTRWDQETLQSFRKTDANQDGIISAQEWSAHSK